MALDMTIRALLLLGILYISLGAAKKSRVDKSNDESEKWKKKDIRDYNDADMERLLDQWEESDEDELEEDELPEWKRKPPQIDLSQLDPSDPEGFIKVSKKGKTLMMFATVSGDPTEQEVEQITSLWHSSLFNAHYEAQRYVVGKNRVLFMLTDGSKAWEIRDFLVKQERCEEVSIEGQSYPGAGAGKNKDKKAADKGKADKKIEKEGRNRKTEKEGRDKKTEREGRDKLKDQTKEEL